MVSVILFPFLCKEGSAVRVSLGFPFSTCGAAGWVGVGTGVACEGLKDWAMVWGGGTCCPLALDTGGVESKLSSDIESLELLGSVLVCRRGVPLGLGVLGQLASFWIVEVTVASVCCSNSSTLAVSSSSGV